MEELVAGTAAVVYDVAVGDGATTQRETSPPAWLVAMGAGGVAFALGMMTMYAALRFDTAVRVAGNLPAPPTVAAPAEMKPVEARAEAATTGAACTAAEHGGALPDSLDRLPVPVPQNVAVGEPFE